LPKKLGHHQGKVGSLGNRVPVTSMVVDDQIVRPERRYAADG